MLRFFKKRELILLMTVIISSTFLLSVSDPREHAVPTFIERGVIFLFSPLQVFVIDALQVVRQVWRGYIDLIEVQKVNDKLQEEIRRLKEENNRYIELTYKYERLRKLLEFKEEVSLKMVPAEIIGLDSANWSRTIIVNKGEQDGVRKNSVAVTHEGLVGRVLQVSPASSKVILLTDVRSAVDAFIQRSRSSGIVVGSVGDTLRMRYIPLAADIRVGDTIISSGFGGIFPKGLVIGTISSIDERRTGMFREAEITPRVDFSKLEEIFVVQR